MREQPRLTAWRGATGVPASDARYRVRGGRNGKEVGPGATVVGAPMSSKEAREHLSGSAFGVDIKARWQGQVSSPVWLMPTVCVRDWFDSVGEAWDGKLRHSSRQLNPVSWMASNRTKPVMKSFADGQGNISNDLFEIDPRVSMVTHLGWRSSPHPPGGCESTKRRSVLRSSSRLRYRGGFLCQVGIRRERPIGQRNRAATPQGIDGGNHQ